MAAKVINDINEQVLLCSVCQARFDIPKTLGCQHSFCLKCIELWVDENHGVLSCPMCRRKCDIPNRGLTDLPSSYFINQLLDYTADLEGKTPDAESCVMCNSSATAHCMECSSYLCSQCGGNHCRLPFCQSHTVLPLEKYKSMDAKERAAAKPVMCPKHNNVGVECYCAECSLPVCMKCAIVGHKGHEIQELDTAFDDFKTIAKETLVGCSDKMNEVNADLRRYSDNSEQQHQSVIQCTEDVKRHAKTLHQMIDDAEKKILDDLTKSSEILSRRRQKEQSEREVKLKQLQNASMFIESLIEAPQPIAALFDANKSVKEAKNLIGNESPMPDVNSLISRQRSDIRTVKAGRIESRQQRPHHQALNRAISFHLKVNTKLTESDNLIGKIQFKHRNQFQDLNGRETDSNTLTQ